VDAACVISRQAAKSQRTQSGRGYEGNSECGGSALRFTSPIGEIRTTGGGRARNARVSRVFWPNGVFEIKGTRSVGAAYVISRQAAKSQRTQSGRGYEGNRRGGGYRMDLIGGHCQPV